MFNLTNLFKTIYNLYSNLYYLSYQRDDSPVLLKPNKAQYFDSETSEELKRNGYLFTNLTTVLFVILFITFTALFYL